MIKRIIYDSVFVKNIRKLPFKVRSKFEKIEPTFRTDPHSPQLKTHKLHGMSKNYYAFSINHKYRIIFKFIDEQTVAFVEVGTHEIYE